jgi:hypothetical protein
VWATAVSKKLNFAVAMALRFVVFVQAGRRWPPRVSSSRK